VSPSQINEPYPRNHLLELAQRSIEEHAHGARRSIWKPRYHFSPPSGWMNDPNGLIQFKGTYHLFYQAHPYSAAWGPMHWGHATSPDLVHWKHEMIALAPDQPYEAGCFSGCAVNDTGVLTLLYTAHNDDRAVKEVQCIARGSEDCLTFTKSPDNPIIAAYPTDGSPDFRDPKVWRQDGRWNMAVGTSKHNRGRVVLYSSDDLEQWEYRGVMCESDGNQGTMWECPNFSTLDGQDVMIVSPMNMKGHKNISITGTFDNQSGEFTQTTWAELDHGADFYAAHVFDDESGRTILMAWMDMWGSAFPTQKDGWAGTLTIPRVLSMRGTTLLQQPLPELSSLREESLLDTSGTVQTGDNPLESLSDESMEIRIEFQRDTAQSGFECTIMGEKQDKQSIHFIYDGVNHAFALHQKRTTKHSNKDAFKPCLSHRETIDIRLFIDTCSVEVFIDEGALCFSQKFYFESTERHYAIHGNGLKLTTLKAWRLGDAFK